MAYPRKRPFYDKYYTVRLDDISSADNVSIPIVAQGEFIGWGITLDATITGTAEMTVELNGTAISSAARSMAATVLKTPEFQECTPQAVAESDNLEFITDGGSTNTSVAWITAVIREA